MQIFAFLYSKFNFLTPGNSKSTKNECFTVFGPEELKFGRIFELCNLLHCLPGETPNVNEHSATRSKKFRILKIRLDLSFSAPKTVAYQK